MLKVDVIPAAQLLNSAENYLAMMPNIEPPTAVIEAAANFCLMGKEFELAKIEADRFVRGVETTPLDVEILGTTVRELTYIVDDLLSVYYRGKIPQRVVETKMIEESLAIKYEDT